MTAARSGRPWSLLLVVLGPLGLLTTEATAQQEPAVVAEDQDDEPEPSVTSTASDPNDTAVAEPEPEPEPEPAAAVCEPQCPEGSTCFEGQCFLACDPLYGECEPNTAAPNPETEPAPTPDPEPAPTPDPDPDPDPDGELLGLGLRIAPGVSACMGSGCRQLQVGTAGGSMGVGGALDLRVAYRVTRHLSIEAGGLASFHGNDIRSDPLAMWAAALVGPRLHLSGGRWRAEPIVGLQLGYARSLIRWSNAGLAGDGLALGADAGVELQLSERLSLGMLTGATVPYWTRVCDVDDGIKDCYRRSELTRADLRRWFWTTSAALVIRL